VSGYKDIKKCTSHLLLSHATFLFIGRERNGGQNLRKVKTEKFHLGLGRRLRGIGIIFRLVGIIW
jgi:hypothetical protein